MVEIPAPDLGTANEWSLVLYARGIEHRVVVTPSHIGILVEDDKLDNALSEIEAYQEENRAWGQWEGHTSDGFREVEGTILACIILFALFSLFLSDYIHQTLISVGANESERVMKEHQFWRPITALTLHQDPSHLLSNMVIGGVFLVLLIQLIGSPLAWATTFFAGVCGNLLSLLIRGHSASSIGASTSVFGALGAITGILLVRSIKVHGQYRRPIVYLGTGLALLSFLGVGDRFTDRTAHLMGFLVGGAMGVFLEIIGGERVRERLKGHAFPIYAFIIITIIGAWYVGMKLTGTTKAIYEGFMNILWSG